MTDIDSGVGLPHKKFPSIAEQPPGTIVEIGRAATHGPALDWRLAQAQSIPGLCEVFCGTLQQQENKEFAFIRSDLGKIFVPPNLAKIYTTKQKYPVKGRAIMRKNRQGKTGWRAVYVYTADIS